MSKTGFNQKESQCLFYAFSSTSCPFNLKKDLQKWIWDSIFFFFPVPRDRFLFSWSHMTVISSAKKPWLGQEPPPPQIFSLIASPNSFSLSLSTGSRETSLLLFQCNIKIIFVISTPCSLMVPQEKIFFFIFYWTCNVIYLLLFQLRTIFLFWSLDLFHFTRGSNGLDSGKTIHIRFHFWDMDMDRIFDEYRYGSDICIYLHKYFHNKY